MTDIQKPHVCYFLCFTNLLGRLSDHGGRPGEELVRMNTLRDQLHHGAQ
ncbi:MAG: hypothetical protein JWQ49_2374 [Edaphobacter sp.]|nr:hypothetical protein [Edaphobacter sp.]